MPTDPTPPAAPTIPPPTETDLSWDIAVAYVVADQFAFPTDGAVDETIRSLIRRCHAAEKALAAEVRSHTDDLHDWADDLEVERAARPLPPPTEAEERKRITSIKVPIKPRKVTEAGAADLLPEIPGATEADLVEMRRLAECGYHGAYSPSSILVLLDALTARSLPPPADVPYGHPDWPMSVMRQLETERAARVAAEAEMQEALKYAGFGEPYPFDRLPQLIGDRQAQCRNQDDRDYWRFVGEKLTALLRPGTGGESQ